MKRNVQIKLTWHPETPLQISTGIGGEGFIHKYIARNEAGHPLIPGSTLKGRLRYYTQMAYQHLGGTLHQEGKPCRCAVCLLLGSPGASPASLAIGDLIADEPAGTITTRHGIAIDPHRKVVKDGALLLAEQVFGSTFTGQISGFVVGESAERDPDACIGLLGTGIRLIREIGGAKSRGTGHGHFKAALQVDGAAISEQTWQEWAEVWKK